MPPIFTVKPIFVNDVTGEESPFYDEVGTPEFYMIIHTLQKYLAHPTLQNQEPLFHYLLRRNTNYC